MKYKTLLLTLLVMMLLVGFVSGALDDDVSAAYTLDDDDLDGTTVIDVSGATQYNATNNGATTGVTGKINEAFDFDGIDDEIKMDTNLLTTFIASNDFTFNFWVNATNLDDNDRLYEFSVDGQTGDLYTNFEGSANEMDFKYYDGSTNHIVSVAIPLNEWHMVTVTMNSGTMEVFLNTISKGSVAINDPTGTYNVDYNGFMSGDGMRYVTGRADEIGVWNRTLTSTEISELYNSGDGLQYPFSTATDYSNSLNITDTKPTNNTQYNFGNLNFNATIDSTYDFNCSLYIDDSLENTLTDFTAGTDVFVNITKSLSDGSYNFYWNCSNNGTSTKSTTNEFYIDTVDPTITFNNPANQSFMINGSLTADIDITDDNLYSYYYNISQDSSILFSYSNTSLTGLSSYKITDSSDLANKTGELTATVKVCDGHTNNDIDFNVQKYNKELIVDNGEITIGLKSTADYKDLQFIKKSDRYSFEFETMNANKKREFIVESDKYIDILDGKTEYEGHLVIGNKWIDFEEVGTSITVNRISDYKVEIIAENNNAKDHWKFNSIGELNCITESVDFYIYNVTNENYISQGLEGQTTNFNLSIPYDSTYISDINATLNYNGTTYTPTETVSGGYYVFDKDITLPQIDPVNQTNVAFYWDYELSGTTSYDNNQTNNKTQGIYHIRIDDCSTYSTPTVNFSFFNETDDNSLSTDAEGTITYTKYGYSYSYAFVESGVTDFDLCIYPSWANFTGDIQLEYGEDLLSFFSDSLIFDNSIAEYELYLLDDTTQVLFSVVDQNDNDLEDVYIYVKKYDLGTNTYQTTEQLKTDTDGNAVGNVVLNDVWYKFTLYYQGNLVFESDVTKITSTTKLFIVNLRDPFYEDLVTVEGVTGIVSYTNSTNNFRFTYTDPANNISQGCLKVTQRSVYGDTVLGTNCSTSAGSTTLLFNIGNNTDGNTYFGTGYVTLNGQDYLIDSHTVSFGDNWETYGEGGVFISFLFILALTMIGLWNPMVALVLMTIGFFFMNLLGFYNMGWEHIAMFVILVGLAIYRLGKE